MKGEDSMTKRNSMEISVKGLTLAVVVIIALMISALSLYIVNKAKGNINNGNAQFSQIMDDYSELTATIYDGMHVNGEKVIECIDEMTKEDIVSVTVLTGENRTLGAGTGSSGNTYAGAAHVTSTEYDAGTVRNRASDSGESPYIALGLASDNANYINPMATFIGKVTKNANGMVVNITFEQK